MAVHITSDKLLFTWSVSPAEMTCRLLKTLSICYSALCATWICRYQLLPTYPD